MQAPILLASAFFFLHIYTFISSHCSRISLALVKFIRKTYTMHAVSGTCSQVSTLVVLEYALEIIRIHALLTMHHIVNGHGTRYVVNKPTVFTCVSASLASSHALSKRRGYI